MKRAKQDLEIAQEDTQALGRRLSQRDVRLKETEAEADANHQLSKRRLAEATEALETARKRLADAESKEREFAVKLQVGLPPSYMPTFWSNLGKLMEETKERFVVMQGKKRNG